MCTFRVLPFTFGDTLCFETEKWVIICKGAGHCFSNTGVELYFTPECFFTKTLLLQRQAIVPEIWHPSSQAGPSLHSSLEEREAGKYHTGHLSSSSQATGALPSSRGPAVDRMCLESK